MTLTLQDLRVQTQHNLLMTGAANPTRPASLADLVEVLKADPDTLIISKVDGEWPEWLTEAIDPDAYIAALEGQPK